MKFRHRSRPNELSMAGDERRSGHQELATTGELAIGPFVDVNCVVDDDDDFGGRNQRIDGSRFVFLHRLLVWWPNEWQTHCNIGSIGSVRLDR